MMDIAELFCGNGPKEVDATAVKLEPNLPVVSSQPKQSHIDTALRKSFNNRSLGQGSTEDNSSSGPSVLDQARSPVEDAGQCSTSPICAAPVCRQFWKSGIYNDELTPKPTTQSGSSYLHIHPKFLHSNATSHKWAFGAIAELIDNAVDEIRNGATFAIIDKVSNPRNGTPALLIQDDGGGMDPEAMRRCLSFGFSDKKSNSVIGKYGNGFKTSSMRLGADAIVFSRNMTNRTLTQSIGLLSYTFLTRAGYDRIVVPMVHYEYNSTTGSFASLQSGSNENSNLNLSALLQWSPYSTEEELLKQFDDVGSHGTKVIIYNLWYDEEGNMELDFDSNPEDISITWDGKSKVKDSHVAIGENHIAKRLNYSLRAYLSVLYLKLPETFAMVLRGEVVLYHNIATDLKYTEFIMYKPQSAMMEGTVVTTIGFLKEAPNVNLHGFNIYHKNRLILPFWPVVSFSASRGRGVVGVLEANFVEPTHNKQDFEKTSVFQKLAHRLKEMTWEYWDYHCGLLGYQGMKKYRPQSDNPVLLNFIHHHGTEPVPLRRNVAAGFSRNAPAVAVINNKAACYSNSSVAEPVEPSFPRGFNEGSNLKRKSSYEPVTFKREAQTGTDTGSKLRDLANNQELTNVMQENKRLRTRCLEFEKVEERLKLKLVQLGTELDEAQVEFARLLAELEFLEKVKTETTIYV